MNDQSRDREHRRQPQGARDDRGMAVGAAKLGGEAGDPPRVHQRGVGRGQLVSEDDRTLRHAGIGDIRFFDQVANEPRADDADVLDPRRQIGVAHRREAFGDLVDLDLDGALGVDPGAADALVDAAHQPRVRQHRHMRVEQVADFLGGGFRESGSFGLELAQLLQRNLDRLAKASALGLDFALGNVNLVNRKIPAVADVGRPDGDPRRHADAGQPALDAAASCRGPGTLVNPH
jgi:hypothetical protein